MSKTIPNGSSNLKENSFHEYEKIDELLLKDKFGEEKGSRLFFWLESKLGETIQKYSEVKQDDDDIDEDLTYWIKRCPMEKAFQFTSYVGVVPLEHGLFFEILPKVELVESNNNELQRRILFEMICALLEEISHISVGEESFQLSEQTPLYEHLIALFLKDVRTLVNYGLARYYIQVEEEDTYIKGRILFSEQFKRNMGREDCFYTSHDEFLLDRLENRIIKAALLTVHKYTESSVHRRLINELLQSFSTVSPKVHINDLKLTNKDREMKHYDKALAWAQLILQNMSPQFCKLQQHLLKTPSLLFPMHKLFEAFVFKQLKEKYGTEFVFKKQDNSKHLFTNIKFESSQEVKIKNPPLRPDIVVESEGRVVAVMDTKWKTLSMPEIKFAIADLYQMYAYGKKYFPDTGSIFLIYPKNKAFNKCLGPLLFEESPKLSLYIVPFDFEKNDLVLGVKELKELIPI